jgi:Na+/H+ antiporter NhaC
MKKISFTILIALTALPVFAGNQANSQFIGTFWALFPPLIAILLALITKEVFFSLFTGIVLGGLFVGNFSPLKSMDAIVTNGLIEAVKGTAGVFIFLVFLGIIVSLINSTGAAAAFGKWAQKHVKSRPGAMFATFALGILIFIDDYFNCLTVGNVMMPVTDAKKISRAKLAYIIDATAAPICMIAPVSSWAAAVSQYAEGANCSGLQLFIRAIPYNFYSLLTLVFVIALIALKFDYGPMKLHENNALTKGDLFTSAKPECDLTISNKENTRGKICDMLIPLILLMCFSVFALVYVGGYFKGKSFIQAFSNTDASVALPWGALVVLVLSIAYLCSRRIISFKEAMECIPKGFIAMVPAILILTSATALKNMTTLLKADSYIQLQVGATAGNFVAFLPALIFIIATALAFSTGTAWGTFGILIPIVISILPAGHELFYIGISACLAGAVCGDHCSPISDTTIMSSAGAQCNHLSHVSTQLPYALTVGGFSFVGFLLAGWLQNWYIVFPTTLIFMLGLLIILKVVHKKFEKPVN